MTEPNLPSADCRPGVDCKPIANMESSTDIDRHPNCVPGADTATAHEDKFVKYLLNEEHDEGRGKARLLIRIGYTPDNWGDLRDELLRKLPTVEAGPGKENGGGGRNYTANMTITGPRGLVEMRTVWATNADGTTHFVTGIPKPSTATDT